MKMKIANKIMLLVLASVLFSVTGVTVIGYNINYQQIDQAAGEELVGCASITSGLVSPADIQSLIQGDQSKLAKIEQSIDWIVEHKPIFSNASIMTLEGKLLAVDQQLKEQGFKAGDSFYIDQEAVQMIKKMKHPAYSQIYTYGGFERKTGYAPIFEDHDPGKAIVALMAVDFDSSIIKERTWDMLRFTVQIGVIFPIVAAIAAYILVRRMTKPLTLTSQRVQMVASGDLTGEAIEVTNQDEIGDLSSSFNVMSGSLRQIITEVSQTANQIEALSHELTTNAEQMNKASGYIASAAEQVSNGAEEQVRDVEGTSAAIHHMSEGLAAVAASSQQVSLNSMKALERVFTGTESIKLAEHQMNSIQEHVNQLSTVVKGLGNRSQQIDQINGAITDIASQTNLLALNAAIEAAKAGEHGLGFTVVAKEVRKLAEQSAQSAQQIAQLVAMIQADTLQTVNSVQSVTSEVTLGIQVMSSAGESFEHIRYSVEEITYQTEQVSAASQATTIGVSQVVRAIDNISKVIEETAQGTQRVSATTQEQLASMEEINSSANLMLQMSEELTLLIKRFKTT